MPVQSFKRLFIAFCLLLVAPIALAQQRTLVVGDGTGKPFEAVYGGFMTGFLFKQHNHVEMIGAFYTVVKPDGSFSGNQIGRSQGGPGGYDGPPGVEKTVRCGPGAVVVGLRVSVFLGKVGNVEPLCENLKTGFRTWIRTDWVEPAQGGGGFAPFGKFKSRAVTASGDEMNCPPQQAAVGFTGRYGLIIDAIGLICKRLPIYDQPAPPPPPVVNAPPAAVPGGSTEFRIRRVGDVARCNDYAARVQAVRSQALACGLTGPRYDATTEAHVAFCKNNPVSRADEEDKARADALSACAVRQLTERCNAYAAKALAVRETALRCGLTGPRFDATREQHHGFCMNVPKAATDAEDKARTDALARCPPARGR